MRAAAVEPRTAAVQAAVDRLDLEYQIGRHLWLHASRRCSCGERPAGGLGQHYPWYIAHLASQIEAEGFGRVRVP